MTDISPSLSPPPQPAAALDRVDWWLTFAAGFGAGIMAAGLVLAALIAMLGA